MYLTNALTDWGAPADHPKQQYLTGLEQERDAAASVKRGQKILVVIGNPPYNAFAGTSPKEEGDLIAPYKAELISKWGIKKFNLDDLYVRFFRVAERRDLDKQRQDERHHAERPDVRAAHDVKRGGARFAAAQAVR